MAAYICGKHCQTGQNICTTTPPKNEASFCAIRLDEYFNLPYLVEYPYQVVYFAIGIRRSY